MQSSETMFRTASRRSSRSRYGLDERKLMQSLCFFFNLDPIAAYQGQSIFVSNLTHTWSDSQCIIHTSNCFLKEDRAQGQLWPKFLFFWNFVGCPFLRFFLSGYGGLPLLWFFLLRKQTFRRPQIFTFLYNLM